MRAADEAPSWLLTYQGSVSPLQRDRESGQAEKAFDLTLLIAPGAGQTSEVFWHVEENGRGRWPWTERFGRCRPTRSGQRDRSVVALSATTERLDHRTGSPFLADERRARGHAFSDGRYNYQVERAAKVQGRDVWQVQASNNYGPQFNLRIDRQRPVAVEMTQRVFMGMGQEYRLSLKLVDQQTLEAADARQLREGFRALVDLRSKLNRPERGRRRTGKQLAAVEGLPTAAEAVKSAGQAGGNRSSRSDAEQSGRRLSGGRQFEGRPIENFEIEAQRRPAPPPISPTACSCALGSIALADGALRPDGLSGFHLSKRRDQPLRSTEAVDAGSATRGNAGKAAASASFANS